jgi:hypothetical protein
MADQTLIGFADCVEIAIVHTDSGKPEPERTTAYTPTTAGQPLKIEGTVSPGLQPGDEVYISWRISNRKRLLSDKSTESDLPDMACPSGPITIPWDAIVDEEDDTDYYGPFIYPFVVTQDGDYTEIRDAVENWVGSWDVEEWPIEYIPTVTVQNILERPAGPGNPTPDCGLVVEYNYATFEPSHQFSWHYADTDNNPLGGEQTSVKIFETDSQSQWLEKFEYIIAGNALPLEAQCKDDCEEHCIPFYDQEVADFVCLCADIPGVPSSEPAPRNRVYQPRPPRPVSPSNNIRG